MTFLPRRSRFSGLILLAGLLSVPAVLVAGVILGLNAGVPQPVLRHLPVPVLGFLERMHDLAGAVSVPEPWRDCANAHGISAPGGGTRLPDIPAAQGEDTRAQSEVVIAAVGDVLLHSPLQRQAFALESGFTSLWHEVRPILRAADIAYANLEGPVAPTITRKLKVVETAPDHFDGEVFSSYPLFNYPEALIPALKDLGVDVVSTANNHSLDRGAGGIDLTLELLDRHGLPYTGTRPTSAPESVWHTVTRAGKWRIAWLACTYGTNGLPDRKDQVLHCFRDSDAVVAEVKRLAAFPDIDAVILTPHWGQQYVHAPDDAQRTLARRAVEAGAIAVIGAHPHVIQPWEIHAAEDGRQGLIMYSLGNFVSGQRGLPRRSTIILLMGLAPDGKDRLRLAGARFVPLAMTFDGPAKTGAITARVIDSHLPRHGVNRRHLTGLLSAESILPPGHDVTTVGRCAPVARPSS